MDFLKIESYTIDGSYTGITKRFNFLGENFFCNPDNFCKSFSSGYYFWGGTTGLSNEKLREKSSLMYQIDSNMKIERGYFCTKYGCGGTMDRFKYYQDKVLVIPSAFDYNVYQIDSNDSISIRYKFDFGKFEFDSNKDVDRKLISYNEYVYSLGHLHETDRFLYFTFQYDKFFYYMLYFKETGQSYFQTSSASVIGNDFTFVPIQAIHKDRLISVVDMYAFLFYLERMSEDNRNKWGLNEYKKLDPEDNPVLIFYTPKN